MMNLRQISWLTHLDRARVSIIPIALSSIRHEADLLFAVVQSVLAAEIAVLRSLRCHHLIMVHLILGVEASNEQLLVYLVADLDDR